MSIMADRENVIVVGGGAAGTSIARRLSTMLNYTKLNLILISNRTHMVHYPSIIRTLVNSSPDTNNHEDEQSISNSFIPLDHIFDAGHGELVVGTVASISEDGPHGGHVILEDGTFLTWSVLVLAPGCTWEGPFGFPESKKECFDHVREWRLRFKTAKNIVIAGAGAVGIELATELKDRYPDKDVTIVHSQDMPMNESYPEKWRKVLDDRLQQLRIKMVYNDHIDDLGIENDTAKTRKGESLAADIIVPCRGGRMNTAFISTLGKGVLWSNGCVRINPAFQLLLNKRIFAAGDIIEWEEQKQFTKALAHADIVAKNVINSIRREDPGALYSGSAEVISLRMGEDRGATYSSHLWGLQFGDTFTTEYRSRYLGAQCTRDRLNVKNSET